MTIIECIRIALESLGPYVLEPGTECHEELKGSARITIKNEFYVDTQDAEPDTGTKIGLFKPAPLKRDLADAKRRASSAAAEVLEEIAPTWLKAPPLDETRSDYGKIHGYKIVNERVVDRVDIQKCTSCGAKGFTRISRNVPKTVKCSSCGGLGYRTVSGYINSPGTTAHGTPTTRNEPCYSCRGTGEVNSGTETINETIRCRECGGKGQFEHTSYKNQTRYKVHRVRTQLKSKGREKVTRQLKRLLARAGTSALDRDSLLTQSSDSEVTVRSKRSTVLIDYRVPVPLTPLEVRTETGRKVGVIYQIPMGDKIFRTTEKFFLDKALKKKCRQIAKLNKETVHDAYQEDAFFRLLVDTKRSLTNHKFGYIFSEEQLEATYEAISLAIDRKPGLFYRLFSNKKKE